LVVGVQSNFAEADDGGGTKRCMALIAEAAWKALFTGIARIEHPRFIDIASGSVVPQLLSPISADSYQIEVPSYELSWSIES
jgi:hypothetical protein